jgi:cyclopropane fatty-acyl-phospholipid synthase-like methyltransferase
MKNIYSNENSEYLKNNPTWDVEDSPWKARKTLDMLQKHSINPKTVVEVGCGAGEILNQLFQSMPNDVVFSGYDIAPDAINLAKEHQLERERERIKFYNADFTNEVEKYDLLLAIDVIEHIDDYFGFLRKIRERATWKLIKVPLDISVYSVFRNTHYRQRASVGHIQYFTKDTILLTLQDCGYEIVEYRYANMHIENNKARFSMIRNFLYKINHDFFVRLLGGYGLWILTK